jgi:hypothetical protein
VKPAEAALVVLALLHVHLAQILGVDSLRILELDTILGGSLLESKRVAQACRKPRKRVISGLSEWDASTDVRHKNRTVGVGCDLYCDPGAATVLQPEQYTLGQSRKANSAGNGKNRLDKRYFPTGQNLPGKP